MGVYLQQFGLATSARDLELAFAVAKLHHYSEHRPGQLHSPVCLPAAGYCFLTGDG